jgi:hypothetical protein
MVSPSRFGPYHRFSRKLISPSQFALDAHAPALEVYAALNTVLRATPGLGLEPGVVGYRAPTIDAGVLSVLYDAAAIANLMTAFPNAIYTVAAAIVIYRTAVLPRWIGAGALLIAAIHLGSPSGISYFSFSTGGSNSPPVALKFLSIVG